MEYNQDFVAKVNEIYHDVEGKKYELRHPEILVNEVKRWKQLGEKFIKPRPRPMTILDVGTGTGFVPMQVAEFLRKDDTLVCSDVSRVMLNATRDGSSPIFDGLGIITDYKKIDGGILPMPDKSVDVLTMNSVLHHISDLPHLYLEVDRVLKDGGLFIVAHEPNALFYANNKLQLHYRVGSLFFNPKQLIIDCLMRLGLFEWVRSWYQLFSSEVRNYNEVVEQVNRQLREEGVIDKDLSASEMTEIVDIHSPGAGGKFESRGFIVQDIQSLFLKNFSILWEDTYDHLLTSGATSYLSQKYDQWLKNKFPKDGSHFSVVLIKSISAT